MNSKHLIAWGVVLVELQNAGACVSSSVTVDASQWDSVYGISINADIGYTYEVVSGSSASQGSVSIEAELEFG